MFCMMKNVFGKGATVDLAEPLEEPIRRRRKRSKLRQAFAKVNGALRLGLGFTFLPPVRGGPGDPLRGVSVHYLTTVFVEEATRIGIPRDSTVHVLEPKLVRANSAVGICPRDGQQGLAFVDTLTDPDHAGRANLMLSYTWNYTIEEICGALEDYCRRNKLNPRRTYVWICFLCINQHRVQEARRSGSNVPFEQFADEFGSRVRNIGHVLALIGSWKKPAYLTRAWCIFELYIALKEQSTLELIMPDSESADFLKSLLEDPLTLESVMSVFCGADVRTAEASVPSDKDRILLAVENGPGYGTLNQAVKDKLERWFCEVADKGITACQQRHRECPLTASAMGEVAGRIAWLLIELSHIEEVEKMASVWLDILSCHALNDSVVVASLQMARAHAQVQLGSSASISAQSLSQWLDLCLQSTDDGLKTQAYLTVSMYFAEMRQLKAARSWLEEGLRVPASAEAREFRVTARFVVLHARVCEEEDDVEGANASIARSFSCEKTKHHGTCYGFYLAHLALHSLRRGRTDDAQQNVRDARNIFEETGTLQDFRSCQCLSLMAWTLAELGDPAGALDLATRSVEGFKFQGRDETPSGMNALMGLAYIKLIRGDVENAGLLREQAVAYRASQGLPRVPLFQVAPKDFYL